MLEIIMILVITLVLAWPLGAYMAAVMRGEAMRVDRVFNLIERPIYAVMGVRPQAQMNASAYIKAFLLSSAVLLLLVWSMFMTQAWLPLNPNNAPNMSWDLALHTSISFLTNTNQQHYSGQAQLSYLSQMTAIVGLQYISPMMGLALAVATIRAFFPSQAQHKAVQQQLNNSHTSAQIRHFAVGNYWTDVIRGGVRILLPLCVVWSLLLTSQGVPSTFNAPVTVTTLEAHIAPNSESKQMTQQVIPLGPVAPMVAVKQLGSNGGGWYGPNSASPLENPTPFSNALQSTAILLIPIAIIFMLGHLSGRKKFAALVFASMLIMSVISVSAAMYFEAHTAQSLMLMEGKEQRLGVDASSFWAAITTQVNNGSVNMMHDSAAPLTGLVLLANMLINAIWGGIGCGLQQFWIYLLLAVFLSGLMTGRTPELLGRKIEASEIKWLAFIILLQPLVLLALTAITLSFPSISGISNAGAHGISQVFYEYTSAFANNGSGFEGLADNNLWWNLSASIALLLGRFPTLIIPLWIAVRLANKRQSPVTQGSLQLETLTFALTLVVIIIMLTVLQFLPVLVLGPITDHVLLNMPAVH